MMCRFPIIFSFWYSSAAYLVNNDYFPLFFLSDTTKMEDQYLKCPTCDWNALTGDQLYNHKRWTHSEDEYQCDICEKKFSRSSYLSKHTNAVHLNITHQCDKCDYKATASGILGRHKKSIHEGKESPAHIVNIKHSIVVVLRNMWTVFILV